MYRFHVPSAITHPLAKEMYWELMNVVRAPPYMPKNAPLNALCSVGVDAMVKTQ